jgi:predicted RND superfamily exporter protein
MDQEIKMGDFDRLAVRFGRWVIRWRWPILAIVLILVAAVGSGVRHLGFATNYRVFFGPNNPELEAFEAVQNIYTKNDSILFAVTPDDGEIFSSRTLAAIEDLTERAWQIPASIRVDSITNFQHSYAEEDDLIVEDLVFGAAQLTKPEISHISRVALARPELVGRLLAPSAAVAGVNVTLQLEGKDPAELHASVEYARALVEEIEAEFPHVDLRLSGISMLNSAFVETGIRDMRTLIPLMYLVLIVVMVVLLRSVSGTIATVAVIALSAISAMGVAGFNRVLLDPVSSQAVTMILTMAVADSIHILVTMFGELRNGSAKNDAIVEAVRVNLVPVLLTSLTTAIGFLSMNFSDSPPLHRLGNITATGVIAAFILAVSFLPALMAVLPVRTKPSTRGSMVSRFDLLGNFVVARRRSLLWVMSLVVLAIVAFLPRNEINDRFVHYFDETVEFRRDSDYIIQNLTGIYQLQFSLESGEPGGISNPGFLKHLAEFAAWLREHHEVMNVSTLSDTLEHLNMNMHADDPEFLRLPTERDMAAQYLLLYEMSLPYGLDLNNQINVDKSSTRLIATLGDVPTKQALELAAAAEAWLEENALPSMAAKATGPSVMFSHITERNIKSMIVGTAVAFSLISLILTVALRSWKLGFLSLIPNLAPAAMAFGAWGILVGRIGFAVSVVGAMTLGIVVDDTVHFMTKYLRARREKGLDPSDAVRYSFHSVGRALWVTSMILVAGFMILAQSSFKQNSDMGLLAAVTIIFALVADFFLLPPLLMKIDGPTEVEKTSSEN